MPENFSGELRQKTDTIWQKILQHPFVKGIGAGNLERDKYEFYLKQDYIYLIDFSRVFGLAAVKSRELSDMSMFAALMNATLNTEMDLHRKTCAEFGISKEELEQTPAATITTAYTSLLVRTCYEGAPGDILAVLLPCAAGYVEIGQYLKSQGLPEHPHYRAWIETYASAEFDEFAKWLAGRLDDHAADASRKDRQHWFGLYHASARFEYLFFDMSWRMEM